MPLLPTPTATIPEVPTVRQPRASERSITSTEGRPLTIFQSGYSKMHFNARNTFKTCSIVYPTVAHYYYIKRAEEAGKVDAVRRMHETRSPNKVREIAAEIGLDAMDLVNTSMRKLLMTA